MMTVEEMKAKQAADLAKLEREHAIAALAPIPPRSVQLTSGSLGHWVSYDVADLWEALDVMAKFNPITFYEYRGTFTRFVPAALNTGKGKIAETESSGPYLCKLDVSQGEGFGPTVYLAFFTMLGDDVCMIRLELKPKGYGPPCWHNFGASFQATPSGQSRRMDGNRYIAGDFRSNGNLSGLFDKVTKWGTGSREAAQFGYALMADHENADGSAGWIDGFFRLENIAEVMHGPRKESE